VIEVWSEEHIPFTRWLTTLSYILESPITPTSLVFLKAKKAALNTNFKDNLVRLNTMSSVPSQEESLFVSSFGESFAAQRVNGRREFKVKKSPMLND
jgi:hypothetical protein